MLHSFFYVYGKQLRMRRCVSVQQILWEPVFSITLLRNSFSPQATPPKAMTLEPHGLNRRDEILL